jgi:hypothetical protein
MRAEKAKPGRMFSGIDCYRGHNGTREQWLSSGDLTLFTSSPIETSLFKWLRWGRQINTLSRKLKHTCDVDHMVAEFWDRPERAAQT